MNEYKQDWTLKEGGIYKSKSPSVITLSYINFQVNSEVADYAKNPNRTKLFLVLVDISELTECSDEVLDMINHSIRPQANSRLAYFGGTESFEAKEKEYYTSHVRAENFKTFDTEEEATLWLLSPSA